MHLIFSNVKYNHRLPTHGAWLSERLRRKSNKPDIVGSIPITTEFFLISWNLIRSLSGSEPTIICNVSKMVLYCREVGVWCRTGYSSMGPLSPTSRAKCFSDPQQQQPTYEALPTVRGKIGNAINGNVMCYEILMSGFLFLHGYRGLEILLVIIFSRCFQVPTHFASVFLVSCHKHLLFGLSKECLFVLVELSAPR